MLALRLGPQTSTLMIIHLWYSAMIPATMNKILETNVLPLIEDVYAKIKDKPASSIQAKNFGLSHGTLRVVLKKEQWCQLVSFFQVPEGLTREAANAVRRLITLNPSRVDHLDRALYRLSPGKRTGTVKFRTDGILLPFGCSTEMFDTPNPYVGFCLQSFLECLLYSHLLARSTRMPTSGL
jgi:hypothetical protein